MRSPLLLVLTALLTTEAAAADAANGQRLAERWCSTCHIISTTQQQGSTDAPPFSQVANRADFDAGRLALFLLDPHPKMPNMSLTRSEASDIAAYISSLKQ